MSLAAPSGSARRTYGGFREWVADAWIVLRCARRLRAIYVHELIDAALREQIMLAVSRVNACRWCVRFHETQAAQQGGGAARPAGAGAGADARLHAAVAYAVARAEAGRGREPDPAVDRAFRQRFGARQRSDVEALITLITFANLTANSVRAVSDRVALRRGASERGCRFSFSRGGR